MQSMKVFMVAAVHSAADFIRFGICWSWILALLLLSGEQHYYFALCNFFWIYFNWLLPASTDEIGSRGRHAVKYQTLRNSAIVG